MARRPIYVTQPFLAPLNDYKKHLNDIWQTGILTHNGPKVQEFEKRVSSLLNIRNLVAVTNGTIALQMAIRALDLSGEIITTPFTWVATVSAIKWERCVPIYCDIDSETLNIDPMKIEGRITNRTVAIMPVHVFGNPCEIDTIADIAKKHDLKVIYDAAHAVGTTYKGSSILNQGDISTTSFHSTKVLNTGEGGGCTSIDQNVYERLKRIRFFGHDDKKIIVEDGINGKMTEVHASLGLSNLEYLNIVLWDRKNKYELYYERLKSINTLRFQKIDREQCNYSYFPILFPSEAVLLEVKMKLESLNIFPRRYFFPSLNTLQSEKSVSKMPISEIVSQTILCLPLYYELLESDIVTITDIIIQQMN